MDNVTFTPDTLFDTFVGMYSDYTPLSPRTIAQFDADKRSIAHIRWSYSIFRYMGMCVEYVVLDKLRKGESVEVSFHPMSFSWGERYLLALPVGDWGKTAIFTPETVFDLRPPYEGSRRFCDIGNPTLNISYDGYIVYQDVISKLRNGETVQVEINIHEYEAVTCWFEVGYAQELNQYHRESRVWSQWELPYKPSFFDKISNAVMGMFR